MRALLFLLLLASAACAPTSLRTDDEVHIPGCALSNGVVLAPRQQSDSVCGKDNAPCRTCLVGETCASGECRPRG